MYVVLVNIQVKPEHVDAFVRATEENHRNSVKEPGCRRFDVLRANEDPTRFRLYEIYISEDAFKAHQQTPHFFRWRDTVEPMMAQKRVGERLTSIFPEPWA